MESSLMLQLAGVWRDVCVGGTLEATLDCLSFEVGSLLYIIPFHVGTKRGSGVNVMMPQLQRYVVVMLGWLGSRRIMLNKRHSAFRFV